MLTDLAAHIPSQATLPLLGTIDVHWDYHAYLMTFVWLVLVPLCIIIMRFHKPPPSPMGIRRDVRVRNPEWWFFTVHKFGLFFAMFLALAGTGVALVVSGGFSGSVHAWFGGLTILLGVGQLVSSQMRGSRGGKYREGADPDDPKTWEGDQYNRTPKRRMFEAYHKTSGYFTVLFALGAIGSGLMQYPIPALMAVVIVVLFSALAAWVLYEFKGRAYDGYRVAHGYGLEHPYNKEREFL